MTIEEQAARTADPTLFPQAEKRMRAIDANLKASPLNAIASMVQSPKVPYASKVIMLRQVTDILAEATKGYVPCKDGCSHCCKMATNVTLDEAKLIAKHTGRELVIPETMNDDKGNAEKYNAVPCTFLVNDRCSIYSVRPYACRIHYVVDRDNLLCEILPGEPVKQLMVDTMQFNMLHIAAFGLDEYHFADIRQFFPLKA